MGSDPTKTIGVIQFINKMEGQCFDESDESVVESFLEVAAQVIADSQAIANMRKSKKSDAGMDEAMVKGGEGRRASLDISAMETMGEGDEDEEDSPRAK